MADFVAFVRFSVGAIRDWAVCLFSANLAIIEQFPALVCGGRRGFLSSAWSPGKGEDKIRGAQGAAGSRCGVESRRRTGFGSRGVFYAGGSGPATRDPARVRTSGKFSRRPEIPLPSLGPARARVRVGWTAIVGSIGQPLPLDALPELSRPRTPASPPACPPANSPARRDPPLPNCNRDS